MSVKEKIQSRLNKDGIVILPPMDFFESSSLLKRCKFKGTTSILDPWYNKGIGGTLPDKDYDQFIRRVLNRSASLSNIIYLWGFPEIIGPYVRFNPKGFRVNAWLTWYYKNCPSVIRGWRSSQNACIQFSNDQGKLHPEHFLNSEQKQRLEEKKMRFIPGPSSVIESPLIVGFVGKKENMGHPSQKPESVYREILLMSSIEGDLIIDLMAGSGTTGAVAKQTNRKAILCDMNEEYVSMMEKRTGYKRLLL